MPFTMKGYPEKWKDFEVIKRQKAIEIANAMLKEGYLEKDVVPIAAKKAKDSHGEYIIDKDAHTRLAKEANTSILRRAFNYVDGTDDRTGNFETGLLFIAFQKATKQFIDIQNNLGSNDKLNEYITHRGSASFLVLPGVSKGGYLGETLFD